MINFTNEVISVLFRAALLVLAIICLVAVGTVWVVKGDANKNKGIEIL